MEKWARTEAEDELTDLALGLTIVHNSRPFHRSRALKGFAPFSLSLIESRNDTRVVEYNPTDVYHNAEKYYINLMKQKQEERRAAPKEPGFEAYLSEVRRSIIATHGEMSDADLRDTAKLFWNGLDQDRRKEFRERERQIEEGFPFNEEMQVVPSADTTALFGISPYNS